MSMRLLHSLRQQGVDARMLVMHKSGDSPYVQQVGPAWRRKACFLAEHARIFLGNGLSKKRLFQASIANCGLPLHKHPWVQEADIVVLAWVNQGMISLKEIGRIQAPVVWVMHDMWCMTGICHHACACDKYMYICGKCPILGARHSHDLSTSTQRRKARLYGKKKIHFVAVSSWLGQKGRESALLGQEAVSVIPNVFPLQEFSPTPRLSRAELGLPQGKLVAMGAARLDDPVKGLPIAIDALNRLSGISVVFFGALKDVHALDGLRIPYKWLGQVHEPEVLADVYAHADVVLSSSHYETLPGTLIEGMACGCVPVTFGQGGQRDIVEHLRTGYIAQHPSAQDLADGIAWAMQSDITTEALRQSVQEKFGAEAVARRYIELFNNLLKK